MRKLRPMRSIRFLAAMFCLAIGAPAQTLSPASLTFPNTVVGTSSGQQIFTLTNSPAGALTISSITASGDFSSATNCPLTPKTLAPGASCKIGVTFKPTALGLRTGTLTVSDNAIPLGGYEQFTAVLNYSDGSQKDATTVVSWSSSDATVATVSNAGLATGFNSGSTAITATLGSVSGGTTLTVSQPQCTAPPAGLTGWWTGDGDTVDIAGSNSGMLQNGAGYGPGEVAQGFSLSGNNASVLVNAPEYSPAAGTLMLWFMSSGGGVMTGSITGSGNRAPGLSIDPSGNLGWEFGDLFAQSLGQASSNQWHHVALTYAQSGSEVAVNVIS